MNFTRTTRATYLAAFLLGALIALALAAPARSAEPSPLAATGGSPAPAELSLNAFR